METTGNILQIFLHIAFIIQGIHHKLNHIVLEIRKFYGQKLMQNVFR